jgi:hypothetical protein
MSDQANLQTEVAENSQPSLQDRFVRDENGLLKGVNYKFLPDGRVDWKKMFLPEHVYLRKDRKTQIEAKYNKPFEEVDIQADNVADEFILSTLAGSRYLLWLRGYDNLSTKVAYAAPDYAAVECRIDFVGNFETGHRHVGYTDVGHACPASISGDKIYKTYLVEIASNRALVRAIRAFLNIAVVSKEEVAGVSEEKTEAVGENIMANNVRKKTKELGLSKKADLLQYLSDKQIDVGPFDKLEDLSNGQLLTILGALK